MPEEPSTTPENEADVEQENVGRENMAGSGEWPDPDTPPRGPAGGERSAAEQGGGQAAFKDVLEADPVLGGSAVGAAESADAAGAADSAQED